jgi:hypothetical protein
MHVVAPDSFLDLKALSKRSCMSVRTLRDDIRDPERPLPCYRKAGKVFVRWVEFCQWMEGFRHVPEDMNSKVDDHVSRLLERVS